MVEFLGLKEFRSTDWRGGFFAGTGFYDSKWKVGRKKAHARTDRRIGRDEMAVLRENDGFCAKVLGDGGWERVDY
jgi:hypothetical protein